MSTTVALLMLALQLLNAVAQTQNAPQSLRDSATSVANMAIVEANKQLANNPNVSTQNTTKTDSANQNLTIPSGTVMGADGVVVSTSTSSSASALSVKLGVVTITRPGKPGYAPYHAHIEWSTNIPTESKIFFSPTGQWQNVNPDGSVNSTYFLVPAGNPLFGYMGATTAVMVNSVSGYSTMHSVELNNLQEKYQYSYTIEAISGTLDQKITGTFDTK